ncbi:hypothetical protein CTEN210_12161 [Chaetoceros tenuissimus]|uniref:MYND-type domain-containing protein n=1 Tax=Chaetoceros tenuissimus TaxID=426638 RepID=A0AAD3H9T8_9STRA|nr:hypothetical protein CTEN210_12161 [Chaetoceros tenuissimus]
MADEEVNKDAVETAQTGIEAMSIQDKSGDKDSAEADLKKYNKAIDSTRSPDAQLLANRARAFYHLEKYRDAIKDCEDAIAKDPKCLLALQICGRSFLALKQYGDAATELRAAQAVSHDESIEKELSKLYKTSHKPKAKFVNPDTLEKMNFDEKQEGWQPGERNTKNRAKKNEKNIKKSAYGAKSEIEWLHEKWMSSNYVPNATNVGKKKLGDGYAVRKMRKYDQDFLKKAEKMQNLRYKFYRVTGSKEEKIKFVRKIEKAANDLQNEIIKVLKVLGIHDIGFIPSYLPSIITNRCLARMHCAMSIGPEPMVPCKKETYPVAYELFRAAIEDADECIRIVRFPEFITSLAPTMKANPMAIFASANSVEMNLMLMNRGRSYQYLEEYELAMNDFKALCSRKRMDSPQSWNQPPTLRDATMECLNTATLIKLRDKVPRPHYTKEELEKFEKEVGLGLYSAEKFLCGFCRAKQSNEVNLRLCAGCNNAWFCSQECLKKAWKTGHKAKCEPKKSPVFSISIELITKITKEVKETGFSGFSTSDQCYMICQDENGEYFDSLSDGELDLLQALQNMVQGTPLNCLNDLIENYRRERAAINAK